MHPHAAPSGFNTHPPPAIVYFQDPLGDIDIDLDSLMQLFDLSEAEARVAAGIAQGQSPQQIADSHFLSVHTRTQLKSTFQKTGTMRQSELAKLMLTSCRPALAPSSVESELLCIAWRATSETDQTDRQSANPSAATHGGNTSQYH